MPELPSEVEMETGTLRDLVARVFREVHFAKEIADPKTGEIELEGIFELAVNGMPYQSLPHGLDTGLHDGDTVTLAVLLLGGG